MHFTENTKDSDYWLRFIGYLRAASKSDLGSA